MHGASPRAWAARTSSRSASSWARAVVLGGSAETGEKNGNSARANPARAGGPMAPVRTILRLLQSKRIVFDQGETERTIERRPRTSDKNDSEGRLSGRRCEPTTSAGMRPGQLDAWSGACSCSIQFMIGGASWTWWIGFHVAVLALLVIDSVLPGTRSESKRTQTMAWVWTAVLALCAAGFAGWIAVVQGRVPALQFVAGYTIETSLSVDNLFVFLVLFEGFRISPQRQHTALLWGVGGAVVMRAAFIAAGVTLLKRFDWITYVFGLFLLYAAWRLVRGGSAHAAIPDWIRRLQPAKGSLLPVILAVEVRTFYSQSIRFPRCWPFPTIRLWSTRRTSPPSSDCARSILRWPRSSIAFVICITVLERCWGSWLSRCWLPVGWKCRSPGHWRSWARSWRFARWRQRRESDRQRGRQRAGIGNSDQA